MSGLKALPQERVRELFDYDAGTGELVWRTLTNNRVKVGAVAGTPRADGYRKISVDGRFYLTHRLVWLWHHGELPQYLDHIDRDPSNNRIENLRPATSIQNGGNMSKRSGTSSQWKGVCWSKRTRKWQANIRVNDKLRHLGRFTCEADAAQAYNGAAHEAFGEFACLNSHPANELLFAELMRDEHEVVA